MNDALNLELAHGIFATAAVSESGIAGAKLLRERLLAKSSGQVGLTLGAGVILAALHMAGLSESV